TLTEALALVLLAASTLAAGATLWWVGRHYVAIVHLQRGVGDTMIFGADGRPWFALDEQRRDVPLDQVSPHLRKAAVAVEARRFYLHPGVDPVGLGRALWTDVRRGGATQGGSTLTQQLARTLFLSNQRTLGRKAREAALALMLEQALTKDQILELYLNR